MARRREVKKKRKAVEKKETKNMFADFEEGVSKAGGAEGGAEGGAGGGQKDSEDKCEGGAAADPEL